MKTTLLLVVIALAGCNQTQQQKFQDDLTATRAALVSAKVDIEKLRAAATTMPASPARDQTLDALAKAESIRAQLESKVASTEALMVAAKSGDQGGVGAAISSGLAGIPYVGPYAPLIGVIGGIAYGIWQASKRKSEVAAVGAELASETANLTNVVKSLEAAGPEWSEADKKAIATVQGVETSARVEEIKRAM